MGLCMRGQVASMQPWQLLLLLLLLTAMPPASGAAELT